MFDFIYRGFTGGSDRKEAARGVGDLGVSGFFSLFLFNSFSPPLPALFFPTSSPV